MEIEEVIVDSKRERYHDRIVKSISSCIHPQQCETIDQMIRQYEALFNLNPKDGDVIILNSQLNRKREEIQFMENEEDFPI